jgi:hypothetical protein
MSILESTYTTNMELDESQKKLYLAEEASFVPEKLEIWILDYDL